MADGHSGEEPTEYDELVEAAALEAAEFEAARRRRFAWLLSILGSVAVLAIAVDVTSYRLTHRPIEVFGMRIAPDSTDHLPQQPPPAGLQTLLSIASIQLPAGWLRSGLVGALGSGTWTLTWIAPRGRANAAKDLTPALVRAGWAPCAPTPAGAASCWRKGLDVLTVSPPRNGSCSDGTSPCQQFDARIELGSSAVPS